MLPRVSGQIRFSAVMVLCAVAAQAYWTQVANASCGDWLAHPLDQALGLRGVSLPGGMASRTANDPGQQVPECRGPHCRPTPMPVLPRDASSVELHQQLAGLYAVLSSARQTARGRCHVVDRLTLLDGHPQPLERPPRAR